jgi:uncharacterized membrane protein YccC
MSVWRSPPVGSVFKLDLQIADALTEQPSLRLGAHSICRTPPLLLRLIAATLRRMRLGDKNIASTGKLDRVVGVARSFERYPRYGFRSAGMRPLAIDHDMAQAMHNGLRTMVAVSLVNAFWYMSHWSAGATAALWTAVICTVLSSRPNAASSARSFLVGGSLAILVGLFMRYVALTMTGSYALLAALLFPCCFLAALARSDARAQAGSGYAFIVLGIVSPQNTMTYDLLSSLNDALAQLIGLGVVAIAFSALFPPALPETRRLRVMRRMVRDVLAVALRPSALLPRPDTWLARMFDRLDQISSESRAIQEAGQTLILVGQGLLTLRDIDDDLRRRAGKIITARLALAQQADAVIVGATGVWKYDNLEPALRPEQGILGLRKELKLFANLRPAVLYDELVGSSPLKPEKVRGLDILIVRELIGDIYFGQPRGKHKAPDGEFAGEREGFDTMRYSEPEVVRIAHVAFKAARTRRKKV